jgi:hypothetical protein
MRAGLRLGIAISAVGLALGPSPVLAQAIPDTTSNTPATDSIGPRELQNFKLPGTVSKPAEAPPAERAAQPPRSTNTSRTAPPQARAAPTEPGASATADSQPPRDAARIASAEAPSLPRPAQTPAGSSVTVRLPPAGPPTATPAAQPTFGGDPEPATGSLAPEHSLSILPWLLAAFALGAGGAYLFFRNRSRHAFAGGPQIDLFVAPDPALAPRPAPPPVPERKAEPPKPLGIVSTRLRPWIELSFQPTRCIVEEQQIVFEFELSLFNSGSAPARDVLIEATSFNAGPTQDSDIGGFFDNPVGKGERIAAIPPLQRMSLTTQVASPRENVRLIEAAGRKVFVPLIAFNALYRWSAGEGQTSQGFLLGRDTKREKMAPFRIDLGPRVFRGVGAVQLPTSVRK